MTKRSDKLAQEAAQKALERRLSVLQRYAERKLTRARAATLLKCSERQINRYMDEHKIDRDPGERAKLEERVESKRTVRMNAARRAQRGELTPQQAAKQAGCSARTIYRYMEGAD